MAFNYTVNGVNYGSQRPGGFSGSLTGRGAAPAGASNIFGSRIGAIPMPNPARDLGAQYPNLGPTNAALSGSILSQLKGELSPATQQAIQDASARFGVENGMPGAGGGTLVGNRTLRDVGIATENQIKAGQAAYNAAVPTVSQTQTVNPTLQADVNATNATNAAAPDPAAANTYAKQLFDQYLSKLSMPSGGTGAATPWWMPKGGDSGWVSNVGSYDWTTNPRYK